MLKVIEKAVKRLKHDVEEKENIGSAYNFTSTAERSYLEGKLDALNELGLIEDGEYIEMWRRIKRISCYDD